jgi:uncharacterized protein YbjT (DUF2867 family)/ligand-binding SRPBCC domain-containing protein
MRVAVTGGTGFVGGHLALALSAAGHEVVVVARGEDERPWAREVLASPGLRPVVAGLDSTAALHRAFEGCDAVAHCAGINREAGAQTYDAVHVRGTAAVIGAAEAAGVRRLALVSFLRARPACGSGYHESKWAAEELVRSCGLEWTVLKPGMMFGRGDHMLDHLSRVLSQVPVYVGVGPRRVRPLAVEDAVRVLEAGLSGCLPGATVGLVGPTEIGFDDAARLVAKVVGSRARFVRAPLGFHRILARVAETSMTVPLISGAQVRMLAEEMTEPVLAPDPLPSGLLPTIPFDEESIRAGLPSGDLRFHRSDFRAFAPTGRIRLRTRVDAPRERCFDVARDVGMHQRAQSGSGERAVAGVTEGLIGGGQWVTWRARHFGLSWRMTSGLTGFVRPAKFVDEQLRGPFARWRHEHRFEDQGDSTLITDRIDYEVPLGPLGRVADSLFLRGYLTRLMERYNQAIKTEAERSEDRDHAEHAQDDRPESGQGSVLRLDGQHRGRQGQQDHDDVGHEVPVRLEGT